MIKTQAMLRALRAFHFREKAKKQERLPIPHPAYRDRNYAQGGRSFYFFDFDDNLIFLTTPIYLFHKKTGEELAVQSGEYAKIRPLLGCDGPFEDYELIDDDRVGSFRNFRDLELGLLDRLLRKTQPFVSEIEGLLARADLEWKGPSWDCFYHAVFNDRPISVITARGHAPETVKQGIGKLVQMGQLSKSPNYLSVYPVTNPKVQSQLLGPAEGGADVASLKRRAIRASVKKALELYGEDRPHRFGMSDDDSHNLDLITAEMAELKSEYPHLSFFVIESASEYCIKREVMAGGLKTPSTRVFPHQQLPLFEM